MLVLMMIFSLILILTILMMFYLSSKKIKWEIDSSSSFECAFTSYFFSRYSFSMHYFMVGLIFLFLDLELCFIMPYFNGDFSNFSTYMIMSIFILILILGIIFEWKKGKLEWKF